MRQNFLHKESLLLDLQKRLPLKLRYPFILCKDRIELSKIFCSWYKIDEQTYFNERSFIKYHFGPNANGLSTFPVLLTSNCPDNQLKLTYLHEIGHLSLDKYTFHDMYRAKVFKRIGRQIFNGEHSIHEKYINTFVKVWAKKLNIPYWSYND